MKDYMTVKKLIKLLKEYDKDDLVCVEGGEGAEGSWGTLRVCKDMEDVIWQLGDVLLKYRD